MKARFFAVILLVLAVAGGQVPQRAEAAGASASPVQAPALQAAGQSQPPGRQHGMMQTMMNNPKHLLAMGYHKNLVTFARMLKRAARQGDTVPKDFARAAITEMRRSADQMEIYHEEASRTLPPDVKAQHAEMVKMMAAHLAQIRDELTQLDTLSKGERVDSRQVLQHLDALLAGCGGMSAAAGICGGNQGGHGRGHGGAGYGGCRDCGCASGCGCGNGCGDGHHHGGHGMPQNRDLMQQRQQMMERMKQQDAEIARLVDRMNSAPQEAKQAIMADIITRIVRQHEGMAAHMEKMQGHQQRQMMQGAGAMAPCLEGMPQTSDDTELGEDDQEGMDDQDFDSEENDPDEMQFDEGMDQDQPPH